jgi:hypothetical protein
MISARTKVALQAAKARGQRLGKSSLKAPEGVYALGTAAIRVKADRSAADRLQIIEPIQAEGITTARGIAAELRG